LDAIINRPLDNNGSGCYDISRYIALLVAQRRPAMFGKHRVFGHWDESPFQKGDLKYVILDLMKDKPRYGYEVIRILEERSQGFYAPSPGAVYPTLQLLEELGYVTSNQQDGKRVYSITDAGRTFLAEREDLAEGIKRRLKDLWGMRSASELRETMAEFRRLGRIVGRLRVRNLDRDKMRRVKEVIAHAIGEIEEILRQ